MVFESMRVGGGRCPPIVVALLIFLCFLLTCNWWSISTENAQLLFQIDQLQEEIKINLRARETCKTLAASCDLQLKQSKDSLASLHIREGEVKKDKENLESSIAMCNGELESLKHLDSTKNAALEALRLHKDTIEDQLNVKREEAQKLMADLEKLKIDLTKLNRTCVAKTVKPAQEEENNNHIEALDGEDNNADTAGEVDDEQMPVLETSKSQSQSPVNQDLVYNLILKGSNLSTVKSNKSYV